MAMGSVEWFDILESSPIGQVKFSTRLGDDFSLVRMDEEEQKDSVCEQCELPAVWNVSVGFCLCADHGADCVAAYANADEASLGVDDAATKIELVFVR